MTNETRSLKAKRLRELAHRFRAKARETQLPKYISLMQRSATELDQLADRIEADSNAKPEPSRTS